MPNIGNPPASHLHNISISSLSPTVSTETIIFKYSMAGTGDVRVKPRFEYEFPKTIYVVLE